MKTWESIYVKKYKQIRYNGDPRAVPSMWCLTFKQDSDMIPYRSKSQIVVLGNHGDRYCEKNDFLPVILYSSFRQITGMAIEHKHHLRQGDFKNTFCNAILTERKKPSSNSPLAINSANLMNSGSSRRISMGYNAVPYTGSKTHQ